VNGFEHPRTLVACIGNIFLGDDAFGCEVARVLPGMNISARVKVVDYGIRGFDLAYALLEPYETIILVDAIARGSRPGTVSILQPADRSTTADNQPALDPHSMHPESVLALARSLGEIKAEIYIVGCEPSNFGEELQGRMGLSEAVAAAVPEAARTVVELINRIHQQEAPAAVTTVVMR
jgi:hydrogenase maturation protease